MKRLNDILKKHPAPWRVVREPHQRTETPLFWIKDANGKYVDVTGDNEEDARLLAYVEAVNIAAKAIEWRAISHQAEIALDDEQGVAGWEVGQLVDARSIARVELFHALDELDTGTNE